MLAIIVASEELKLLDGRIGGKVVVWTRIGISSAQDRMWRYYIEGNGFVSGARTHNYRTRESARIGVVG